MPIRTSEMVKYTDNAFHAVKIAFANEIASFARANGVDGRDVMRVMMADDRLNISTAYLRPGYAFGGSCLPKDLRAITDRARKTDVDLPLLDAALSSNAAHFERGVRLVEASGKRNVGLIGLSFKSATDDLRESPAVGLAERLLGKGYALSIYDEDIHPERLRGANRAFIEQHLPASGPAAERVARRHPRGQRPHRAHEGLAGRGEPGRPTAGRPGSRRSGGPSGRDRSAHGSVRRHRLVTLTRGRRLGWTHPARRSCRASSRPFLRTERTWR